MIKNLFLCFIALWIGSLLSSCQKGEPIVETEELARIAFRSYSTASVDVKRVTIDGKVANPNDANFIFIRNKDADSSSVVAYNSNDQVVLEQRLPLKSGLNTFGVHSKSPIDPSLVVGPNPLGDDVESIPGVRQVKILNYNKTISPNGEPIRLAVYQGKPVYDESWGMDMVKYDENPILITDLISDKIPEEFIKIPIDATFVPKAQVLDKDLKPILIDGQKVFLFFNFSVDIGIVYLPQKESDAYFDVDAFSEIGGIGYGLDNIWLQK
ncbi:MULTISPECIES: hypothetical protein [Sphingobacterium]|uniref:DUF4397 domain-containing protein n=1 Tax=Sphingobacterium siyangense TaxID=459529 RepID=A0A562MQH4_9SPHI|nr:MULTISPECIES: hypothetical protein [Sphingobacterium]TWI22099.1 hypothetical protein IQ31_01503 [Sphingobacterium siyangense]HAF33962.1 hypothetical protein [Sphingobacterium sp.]HAU55678.1 hypothetical protein [Sphingobacterium sp.]